jgi:hypothetical protein
MSKPTPGPWTATHDELECFKLEAGDVAIIDGCGCCNSPWLSSDADARLIAAAPDLLQACQLIVSAFDELKQTSAARYEPLQINAARAAIAKATGGQA